MVWKAHECPYLIVTPFLFITTKSWDCVSKRLLAEPGVGLSKVKEGFWKKEPSGRKQMRPMLVIKSLRKWLGFSLMDSNKPGLEMIQEHSK